jgi:hypothetical protein
MLSVISTLPHYLSIIPLHPHDMYDYKTAILVSSTISVVWHVYGEPANIMLVFDYVAACSWGFYELYYAPEKDELKIYMMNIAIILLNLTVYSFANYDLYHSLWHILSAAKCFYVATIISQSRSLRLSGSPYPSDSYRHPALNTR